MDKFSLYAAQFLTFRELFAAKGHRACSGCGVALAVRHVYKALDEAAKNIDKAAWQIPWEQSLIARQETSSKGIQPALLSIPKQKDGKDKSLLNICFDNECTKGKTNNSDLIKNQPSVASAGGYPYVATACPSHPFDLIEKVRKGWESDGPAFIHILCPCPVGWEFDPQDTVRLGRMAVETRLFPLYEIVQGYFQVTVDEPNPRPLKDYITKQGRFTSWKNKQVQALQEEATAAFMRLKDKAAIGI